MRSLSSECRGCLEGGYTPACDGSTPSSGSYVIVIHSAGWLLASSTLPTTFISCRAGAQRPKCRLLDTRQRPLRLDIVNCAASSTHPEGPLGRD